MDVYRGRGSTRPITFTVEEADEPKNLTGATVTMYMIDTDYWVGEDFDNPNSYYSRTEVPSRSNLKVSGASCVLDADPTTGVFSWTPTAAQMDTPSIYWLQPKIVFSDGSIEYPEPVKLRIYPSLAALA